MQLISIRAFMHFQLHPKIASKSQNALWRSFQSLRTTLLTPTKPRFHRHPTLFTPFKSSPTSPNSPHFPFFSYYSSILSLSLTHFIKHINRIALSQERRI